MKHTTHPIRHILPLAAGSAALLAASSASAFDPFSSPTKEETASFDEVWNLVNLYEDDANPIFQEFKLRGRYQGQYHFVDGDPANEDDWEDRRSRFGFDAKLHEKKLEVRADFQSNDGFRDLYDGLVDAYLRYKPVKDIKITVGRFRPVIGYYDFLQSSIDQPTFERSQIFNQLNVDRVSGASIEGKTGHFTWQAGVYSNSLDPDRNDPDQAFGEFNAGHSTTLGIGYDAKEALCLDRADFRLDWLHSHHDDGDGTIDDDVLARYDDIVSATFWAQKDAWGIVAEGFAASGGLGTDGDVFGFFLQPTYDIIPKRLQLVGRYSCTTGDGPDSVRAQPRYEVKAGGLRGDLYQEFYFGTQYFIHGNKLKLMGGAEYAHLDGGSNGGGYDGTTYLTGIRLSF